MALSGFHNVVTALLALLGGISAFIADVTEYVGDTVSFLHLVGGKKNHPQVLST